MAEFTLIWKNTDLMTSTNSLSETALYRYKSVGGTYINAGFTPANNLNTDVNTVDSPVLDNNRVVEFKISTNCTASGPTDNDNGVQEAMEFNAILPTITKTDSSSNITIDVTNTDINKARFTLRKSIDNSIVSQVIVDKIGTSITLNKTGLDYNTNYYWQTELYSVLNNVEIKSSDMDYVGKPFSPYPFTTNNPPVCDPVTSLTVTSIEII